MHRRGYLSGVLSGSGRLGANRGVDSDGTAQDMVDFANLTPVQAETFFRQLHPGNLDAGRDLVNCFDLSSARRLLDVGGGSGGLAIGV